MKLWFFCPIFSDFIGLHLKFADVAPLNVLLEVEKKKIEAELNLLEQEVDEGESISKEETQNLIDRLVLKDFGNYLFLVYCFDFG